jgi:hypothetical protein
MCDSLLAVLKASDKSYQLLDSVVGAIQASFSPSEVVSTLSIESCANVLLLLCKTASEGYLVGAQDSTTQSLIETVSAFTATADTNTTFYSISSEAFAYLVEGMKLLITAGTLKSNLNPIVLSSLLLLGESISYVSDNVQVLTQSQLLSSFLNLSLTPPQTTADIQYGVLSPSITLSSNGLSACGFGNGYAKISLSGWGKNPYPQSQSLIARMMRVATSAESSAGGRRTKRRHKR